MRKDSSQRREKQKNMCGILFRPSGRTLFLAQIFLTLVLSSCSIIVTDNLGVDPVLRVATLQGTSGSPELVGQKTIYRVSDASQVSLRALDKLGDPVEGVQIQWEELSGTMTLDRKVSLTNKEGVATVQVSYAPVQKNLVQLKANTRAGHELIFDFSNGLENLALWLQASSLNLNDNDPVLTWGDDAPGAIHNLTQSTPSMRPVFLTAGLNGRPSVYFDGGDILARPPLNFGVSSITVWAVYNAIGRLGTLDEARLVNNGHSGWVRGYFLAVDTTFGLLGGVGGSAGLRAENTLIYDSDADVATNFNSGPKISAMVWDTEKNILTLWSQGKKLKISKDSGTGGLLNTQQNELSTVGLNTLSTDNYWTARGFRLGGEISGWAHLVGHISEVLVYNRALTDAQMSRYFQHFSTKYGIPLVP